MTARTIYTHARRRAALLALVLFALGAIGAPMADAWLHADDTAALQDDRHECVVCRLAATPSEPTPTVEAPMPTRVEVYRPRFTPITARLRTPPARLTPPTRAPPA